MKRTLFLLSLLFLNCSSHKKDSKLEHVTFTLVERYGIDLISSKELASKIAEAIWTEKYINDDIQLYKPFTVKLINDGKIWEVIGNSPLKGNVHKREYHMLINKNTGEVLRNYVIK